MTQASLLGRVYAFRGKQVANRNQDVVNEAAEVLESLYVDKHLLKGPLWDTVKAKALAMSSKMQALESLLGFLQDPYARVVPKQQLVVDSRRYGGVKVTLGISIRRMFALQYLMDGFRDAFLPFDAQTLVSNPSNHSVINHLVSRSPISTIRLEVGEHLSALRRVAPSYLAVAAMLLPVFSSQSRLVRVFCCTSGACALAYQLSPYLCPAVITSVSSDQTEEICVGDAVLRIDGRSVPPLPSRWLQKWLDRGEVDEPAGLELMRNSATGRNSTSSKRRLYAAVAHRQYVAQDSALKHYARDLSLTTASGRDVLVRMGYLQLTDFTSVTANDALAALDNMQLNEKNASTSAVNVLVLDLRDNRGGVMTAALELAALFAPYNQVLSQIWAQNSTQVVRSNVFLPFLTQPRRWPRVRPLLGLRHLWSLTKRSVAGSQPPLSHIHRLVLLVNGNTASASEIFVEAAVHHHPRCVTAGSRTVGKNKAQAVVRLADGTGLCFSVCEFRTPSGRSMELGHKPNHFVHIEGRRDIEEFVLRQLRQE
eukprot:gene32845-39716_t